VENNPVLKTFMPEVLQATYPIKKQKVVLSIKLEKHQKVHRMKAKAHLFCDKKISLGLIILYFVAYPEFSNGSRRYR
jgi:hypothetical protein